MLELVDLYSYKLLKEASIRSFSLRSRGKVKGKRFVSRASVDSYFDNQCNQQMSN